MYLSPTGEVSHKTDLPSGVVVPGSRPVKPEKIEVEPTRKEKPIVIAEVRKKQSRAEIRAERRAERKAARRERRHSSRHIRKHTPRFIRVKGKWLDRTPRGK
jgi:hypothetical protein